MGLKNGVPFCLDGSAGEVVVRAINEKIARDAAQGTSSDVTLLVVVGLLKEGEETDESPYISIGGKREERQNLLTIHVACVKALGILEVAIGLAGNLMNFPWGTSADGVGLPDLNHEIADLADEIEIFNHHSGRDYGWALIRPHCGVVFLNGRPCAQPEEKVGMLQRIVEAVKAGRFGM